MTQFDIPVVLFMFKRDKAVDIVKRIAEVKPRKLYLLADQGRNDEEKKLAAECRQKVEAAIDWECEVIKNYAEENRGVYQNIGQGAIWVLRREKWAIFLTINSNLHTRKINVLAIPFIVSRPSIRMVGLD